METPEEEPKFGDYIREIRIQLGFSLRQAAKLLDIPSSYLSRIELNKENPPTVKILKRMATEYGANLDELVSTADRYKDYYGAAAIDHPYIFALYKLCRTLDATERQAFEHMIQKFCTDHGLSLEDVCKDIEKLKQKLPRLQKSNEPLFAAEIKPRYLSKSRIALMAKRFLERHGLNELTYSPSTPIEQLVEQEKDIRLIYNEDLANTRNGLPYELGMSHWSASNPDLKEIHIHAGLDNDDPTDHYRLRFTLAHELFHCHEHLPLIDKTYKEALRRTGQINTPFDEKHKVQLVSRWIDKSGPARKLFSCEEWREWQSNYFAACVLMPDHSVRAEFLKRTGQKKIALDDGQNEKELAYELSQTNAFNDVSFEKSLHELYEVSGMAMAIRLLQLGLVGHK